MSARADADRHRVAAEVLELGETLFDAVLDAAAARIGGENSEPLPEAELRAAAEDFFETLRVMLEVSDWIAPETRTGHRLEGG
jgi:hypothetical protein